MSFLLKGHEGVSCYDQVHSWEAVA